MKEDKLLLEARPSWWQFFWEFVFFWLIIPPLVAVWKRHALVLRVYEDRLLLEQGVLSKRYRELFIKDMRAIDVSQSLIQRIFNIGNVTVGTAATMEWELSMHGLPAPRRIKDLIVAQRQRYG